MQIYWRITVLFYHTENSPKQCESDKSDKSDESEA